MATQMSKKRKFVADGVFFAERNKVLTRELAEDGYSGVEVYQNGRLQIGSSRVDHRKCLHNCIGEVIRIKRFEKERFGIIKRFDKYSRKHSIMFEDGRVELYDLSKVDWELVR